jgi:hypothetical protein
MQSITLQKVKLLKRVFTRPFATQVTQSNRFPQTLSELQSSVKTCLSIQNGLSSQMDRENIDSGYLVRRNQVNRISAEYDVHSEDIPKIDYNEEERMIWKRNYRKLVEVQERCAPQVINQNFKRLAREVGMSAKNMP